MQPYDPQFRGQKCLRRLIRRRRRDTRHDQ